MDLIIKSKINPIKYNFIYLITNQVIINTCILFTQYNNLLIQNGINIVPYNYNKFYNIHTKSIKINQNNLNMDRIEVKRKSLLGFLNRTLKQLFYLITYYILIYVNIYKQSQEK